MPDSLRFKTPVFVIFSGQEAKEVIRVSRSAVAQMVGGQANGKCIKHYSVFGLTLILLSANLVNIKSCKKPKKND